MFSSPERRNFLEKADHYIEMAISQIRETGDSAFLPKAYIEACRVDKCLISLEDLDSQKHLLGAKAKSSAHQVMDLADKYGFHTASVVALLEMAEVHLLLNDFENAANDLRRVTDMIPPEYLEINNNT